MVTKWRLYDFGVVFDALKKPSRCVIRDVVTDYLNRAAHPFFIQQSVRLIALTYEPTFRRKIEKILQNLLKGKKSKIAEVPAFWKLGLYGPVSRLYENGWKPRLGLDEGMHQGALMETLIHFGYLTTDEIVLSEKELMDVFQRFLNHPESSIGLLDNLAHRVLSISEKFAVLGKNLDLDLELLLGNFLEKRLKQKGLNSVIRDLLGIWIDTGCFRFWTLLSSFLKLKNQSRELSFFTLVLKEILDSQLSRNSLHRYAAKQVLNFFPLFKEKSDDIDKMYVKLTEATFLKGIKDDLPDSNTFHAIVQWLQAVEPEVREELISGLAFQVQGKVFGIDERIEYLVEELLGGDAWTAICAFQDPKFWKHAVELAPDFVYRGGIDTSTSEYHVFHSKLRQVRLDKHDWSLAKYLDNHIHSVGMKELSRAKTIQDETINILCGRYNSCCYTFAH